MTTETIPANSLELLNDVREQIYSPYFKDNLNKFFLTYNIPVNGLLTQGASKTKRRRKHSKRKIGGTPKPNVKFILLAIIVSISFTVPASSVSSMFECLILYSTAFFQNVIIPFTNVVVDAVNVRDTIGYTALQKTRADVIIPTIKGVYSQIVAALTGNILTFNGLWALYLNVNKFISYVTPQPVDSIRERLQPQPEPQPDPQPELSQRELSQRKPSQQDLNAVNMSLNTVADLITSEKTSNLKTIDIPIGSKLLINENETICPNQSLGGIQ